MLPSVTPTCDKNASIWHMHLIKWLLSDACVQNTVIIEALGSVFVQIQSPAMFVDFWECRIFLALFSLAAFKYQKPWGQCFLIWISFDLFLKVPSSLLPLSCLCLGCQYWPLGVIWSALWKSELLSKMDVLAKNRFITPCSCLISFVRASLQWQVVRGWTRVMVGEQHSGSDINWINGHNVHEKLFWHLEQCEWLWKIDSRISGLCPESERCKLWTTDRKKLFLTEGSRVIMQTRWTQITDSTFSFLFVSFFNICIEFKVDWPCLCV